MQVAPEQLLPRAVPQAPRERVGVPLRRRRVRQRARVLVDAEREDRRLERRDGDLPLGEDADERRRQRTVSRTGRRCQASPTRANRPHDGRRRPSPQPGRGPPARARQTARIRRLDDDQPANGVELETRRLDELQLLGVQPAQLPDVAVERAGDADDGPRIEAAHGEHRRERVEVGVRVRGDDGLGPHGTEIVPLRSRQASATASISTSAPAGSAATSIVARAGGWSPTCFA